MMWVGYARKAELSTNEICTEGKITCKLEDGADCTGKETLSGEAPVGPLKTKEFTINEAGYYEYEFTACG
ncbi:MAG: hypothetical protein PHF45_01765, partial [Candidatus Pacebacteria bacterium]|nr:hypothetical protein [Candidatus Paceibacterota bacterium]